LIDGQHRDNQLQIEGYQLIRGGRDLQKSQKKKGGGVIAYVKEGIKVVEIEKHSHEDAEIVGFTLAEKETRSNIIYRRPGDRISSQTINTLMEEGGKRERYIAIGDLNMNTQVVKEGIIPAPRRLYYTLSQVLGLTQWVRIVTREAWESEGEKGQSKVKSTIDHVWSKDRFICSEGEGLKGMSDHKLLIINGENREPEVKKTGKGKDVKAVVTKRNWKKADMEQIKRTLREGFANVKQGASLEQLTNTWNGTWQLAKRKWVPKKRIKVGKKSIKKRPPESIRSIIRERNKVMNGIKKLGLEGEEKKVAWRRVKELKGEADAKWRELKAESMAKLREEAGKKGSKDWWKLFNAEMGTKIREDREPNATPDEINKAFINKIAKLRKKVETNPKWKTTRVPGRKSFTGFSR
jgi:hypothetical protein